MSQGTKFALALVFIMGAMVLFFVAFHPNSIQPQSGQSWVSALIQSFQNDLAQPATGTNSSSAPNSAPPGQPGA